MEIKILIISNACFSSTDSNGRTLFKLFNGFSSEKLAQFYIYGDPDKTIAADYYHVSDYDALKSFLKQKEIANTHSIINNKNISMISRVKRKTPLKMIIRELIWKYGKWNGSNFNNWLKFINPSHIFLFLGDNSFLPLLAKKIAVEYNIPIIAYSTENYYFKDYNYITKKRSIFYFYLYNKLKKVYRQCEPYIIKGIFNTPLLTEAYQKEFCFPCDCIFAKSDIDFIDNSIIQNESKIKVSYLGNLGLNRYKALIEIADCLNEIVPGTKLYIYGKAVEKIENELVNNKNIKYEGFVDYQEVISIIHKSTLLIHVEYNDEYNTKDLKYAFSTKIADCICSGTPFLIYANKQLAETKFLLKNQCAFVVNSKNQLKYVLSEALFNIDKRKEIVENAKLTREKHFIADNPLLPYFE